MNINRVLLWTIFCLAGSIIFAKLNEGNTNLLITAWLFCIALGIGTAYGTGQMMYVYRKRIEAIIKEEDSKK